MAVDKQDEAEAFRSSLEDALAIIKSFDGTVEQVSDLVGVIELGLENAGQAKLIWEKVKPQRR